MKFWMTLLMFLLASKNYKRGSRHISAVPDRAKAFHLTLIIYSRSAGCRHFRLVRVSPVRWLGSPIRLLQVLFKPPSPLDTLCRTVGCLFTQTLKATAIWNTSTSLNPRLAPLPHQPSEPSVVS